jgi:hypothetical protein
MYSREWLATLRRRAARRKKKLEAGKNGNPGANGAQRDEAKAGEIPTTRKRTADALAS